MSNLPRFATGPHMAGLPAMSSEIHEAATPQAGSYFDALRDAGAPLHGNVVVDRTETLYDVLAPATAAQYTLPDSGTVYGANDVADQSAETGIFADELDEQAPVRPRRRRA